MTTTYVVPPYQVPGEDFEAPWLGTSGSGYLQYAGWVAFSSLSSYVTLHGARPIIDSIDEDTTYVEVNSPLEGAGNSIWVSTFFQSAFAGTTPSGALLEIEARTSDPDALLCWGFSGNQFYYTNSPDDTTTGDPVAGTGWQLYTIPLIDEGVSTRTMTKFLADLLAGNLMAGVHITSAFDVSAIRLVLFWDESVSWVRNIQRNDGLGVSPWRWGSNVKVNVRVVGITFSGFGSNQSIRWRGTR